MSQYVSWLQEQIATCLESRNNATTHQMQQYYDGLYVAFKASLDQYIILEIQN